MGEIAAEDVLHHYLCAYVGPRSDFRMREGLTCPKCGRALQDGTWEVLASAGGRLNEEEAPPR